MNHGFAVSHHYLPYGCIMGHWRSDVNILNNLEWKRFRIMELAMEIVHCNGLDDLNERESKSKGHF